MQQCACTITCTLQWAEQQWLHLPRVILHDVVSVLTLICCDFGFHYVQIYAFKEVVNCREDFPSSPSLTTVPTLVSVLVHVEASTSNDPYWCLLSLQDSRHTGSWMETPSPVCWNYGAQRRLRAFHRRQMQIWIAVTAPVHERCEPSMAQNQWYWRTCPPPSPWCAFPSAMTCWVSEVEDSSSFNQTNQNDITIWFKLMLPIPVDSKVLRQMQGYWLDLTGMHGWLICWFLLVVSDRAWIRIDIGPVDIWNLSIASTSLLHSCFIVEKQSLLIARC